MSRRRRRRGALDRGSPNAGANGAWGPGGDGLRPEHRFFLRDEQRRAGEVDEAPLVLQQLERCRLTRGVAGPGLERIAALPPELRDAVVRLGAAAARAERVLQRVVERVHLDVSPDAERAGMPANERSVGL